MTDYPVDRRALLRMIGTVAGSSAMYQVMSSWGYAGESHYAGPPNLQGNGRGTSVLILGAGLAGMTAALELGQAGYRVQVLEYNDRVGGRNWSLRGGDSFTELGGATQKVEFDQGLYLNPGPWRIPYHHHAVLDYCRRLRVPLEPFIQVNQNAYCHSTRAFGGKPQRFRHIQADFHGNIAELLAKATHQGQLDKYVTEEDTEILLAALRRWGALDKNYEYRQGPLSSERRGYDTDPGGGLASSPVPSRPINGTDLLRSNLWKHLTSGLTYDWQSTMFQPVGGMGMIGQAFGRELKPNIIRFNSKVTAIDQSETGVTVTYRDVKMGGATVQAKADYCICTIPLPILSQVDVKVGDRMQNAINAMAAYVPSIKVGLQFKRRFWEQDDAIYGGISYTDLPVGTISYPSTGYGGSGKGVLLGAYQVGGPAALEFGSMLPDERVRRALEYGSQLHPQYNAEFDCGVAVAWHRVPFSLGCLAAWTDELRERYYKDLCAFDGRVVLAGEHTSGLPWQEGAILSALDAIERLHQRVMAT